MKYTKINGVKYYKLDIILENYKKFNKGCKTNAQILKKHDITDEDYIYAKLDSDKKWIESDGKSKKFDKIFIDKTWFDETYEDDDEKLEEIKDDTEVAPDVIKLTKNEKFYDEDNNVIEIEVRGERVVHRCYFKVEDVSKGFKLPNLQVSILDKKSCYEKDEDYKYFYCNDTKKLFLTLIGFFSVIFSSKKLNKNRNNYTALCYWILNLCSTVNISFDNSKHIFSNNTFNKSNIGFVYCVSSTLLNGIKIGYWTSCLESLKTRYATYYGKNSTINHFKTYLPSVVESQFKNTFKKYNITNEIYDQKYLIEFLEFFKNNRIQKCD